ncbi:MAG TPA: hypothetical protein GXZ90_09485 [Clostridiales bacterium]|nr:hypothetical protein [Clostridiales bacterium]
MKRNMFTVIILAFVVVNVIMSSVLIFFILPSVNKTNKLVHKVAAIIDLELESKKPDDIEHISIEDITTYSIGDKLIVYLKQSDDYKHYAMLTITLSINKKHQDTTKLEPLIAQHEDTIKEIVTDEFSKYTINEIAIKKDHIKQESLNRIQETFDSNFIINISFGNLTLE